MCSWKKFRKATQGYRCTLLRCHDEFKKSIFVAGCQRSGTTILSRIIANSNGMANFQFTDDDELDAALILSGLIKHTPRGRYCFQTTYLNECFYEYKNLHEDDKLIWVIRNPQSVVYSMLYHWKNFALKTLFKNCGVTQLDPDRRRRYNYFGIYGVSRLVMACASYNAKNLQLPIIKNFLGDNRIMVLEYDDLVAKPEVILPAVYDFVELPYHPSYASMINKKSIDKSSKLSKRERSFINEYSKPIYEDMRKHVTK